MSNADSLELSHIKERVAAAMRMKMSDKDEPWFEGWNAAVEEVRRVLAYPADPPPAEYDKLPPGGCERCDYPKCDCNKMCEALLSREVSDGK